MFKETDMTGFRSGRLTVIERGERIGVRCGTSWKCKCSCGKIITRHGADLRRGRANHCGCKWMMKSKTRIYSIWVSMKDRCENRNSKSFRDYGGRGITVCARWQSFKNFYTDMGDGEKGMMIERLDNNAGYSPDNCIWASGHQQARNKRSNVFLTVNGNKMCCSDFDRITGRSLGYTSRLVRRGKQPLITNT